MTDKLKAVTASRDELNQEITEPRKVERAVQEAGEYAESIVATVREPLLVLDADMKVVSANRPFYQTFKVSPEKAEGQSLYDMGNRQWNIPKLRELLEEVLPKNSTFDDFEVEHDFETIGRRIMLLNARGLYREGNKTRKILLAIEDITERKRAQDSLKKYSERLEAMVNERTKDLEDAQEELVRKERLAILGQLAGGVNHELRNPLGVIKNSVYYLSMILPEDDKVQKHLGILEREVGTASRIVGNLLDIARVKAAVRVRTDLSGLVQESLEQTLLEENLEVVTKLAGDLPPVFVDPEQIKQVVGNLIRNAAQAMSDGGTLTIETARADGGAQVAVSDTGVGISPENREKIFQPLFTTKAKGIGLGLALAKELAEASGGMIDVESSPGRGSRFVVRFIEGKEGGAKWRR